MSVGNNISIEDARLVVGKLASQTFIDDEEAIFITFLEREGLLIGWVEKLKSCFDVAQFEVELRGTDVFQNVAKQVVRQFESAQPERRKIECNEHEAELLVNFTCAMLQAFIREHVGRFEGIIRGIKAELRSLIITRRISKWEEVCQILGLDELERFEEDLRGHKGGEAVILPEEDIKASSNGQKKSGRLIWKGKPEKLKKLADELVSMNWILVADELIAFFDPEVEYSGQVVCRNVHRGKIGLLIIFIKDLGLVELKGGNSHWPRIKAQFVGSTIETGEKWVWSRITSDVKNKEQNLRLFFEESRGLLELLGVKSDDIERFFGKKAARWFGQDT